MKTLPMTKVIGTLLVPMLFLTLFFSMSFSATVHATEQSSSDISSEETTSLESTTEDTSSGASSSKEQVTYTIISFDNTFLNTISTAEVNIIQNTSGDIDNLLYFVYPDLCSVEATVQPSDGTEAFTTSLTVKWDCIYSTTTVNPAVVGSYTENGTIELPGTDYVWGEGVSQTVSIPVNVIVPDEPILLTSTSYIPSNAYSLTVGEDLSEITGFLYSSVVCYTDDNKAHPVDIIWNTDNVDPKTVGVYTITGTLGDAPLHHVFSEDLQQTTFTTTVSVQEEGKPNINCFYSSYGVIHFPWEMPEELLESVQVWLQKDDGEWTLLSVDNYDVEYSAEYLMLYMDILVEGCDYRLQVDYEGGQTNICSFHYSEEGMPTMSSVVDGDRDGGDTEGNTSTSTEDGNNTTKPSTSEDSNNSNSDSSANTDTTENSSNTDSSNDTDNDTTREDSNNNNLDSSANTDTTTEDSDNSDSSNHTDTDNDNSDNKKNNSNKNKNKKNTNKKSTTSNQETTNGNQNSNNGTNSNADSDGSADKKSERSTAVSSAIDTITTEQDTESHSKEEQDKNSTDITTITGAELRLMLETSNVARFSCNGITVSCSAASLDALGITDQDVLEISIVPDGNGRFTLSILLNGVSITDLVGMQIMVPYTTASDSPALSLFDDNGNLVTSGTYDSAKNLATFIIEQTGYYSIVDENAPDTEETNPILIFIIVFSVVAVMLLICFVAYTIRRKRV